MTASYAALPFIELDPSEGHLTALSQDGDIVAVGTSLGHLLLYRANSDLSVSEEPILSADLAETAKKRAIRAVRQLAVLAASRVVVSLCDGIVNVHSTDTLELLSTLNNASTRAEVFATNVEEERLPRVVMAVAALKSLVFFRLANPVQARRCAPEATPCRSVLPLLKPRLPACFPFTRCPSPLTYCLHPPPGAALPRATATRTAVGDGLAR